MSEKEESPVIDYIGKGVFLYFLAGLSVSLIVLLLGEVGSIPFEAVDDSVLGVDEADDIFFAEFAARLVTNVLILAPILGVLTGFWGGRILDNVNEAVGFATVVGLIGGFIFVVLVGSLSFLAITEDAAELFQINSLDFTAVVTNGVIAALGTGIAAAGSAYASY